MFVVLDTSILYRDLLLRGRSFEILLESLRYVPARLCVPEVVIDEAVANYRDLLRERLAALDIARTNLDDLMPEPRRDAAFAIDEAAAVAAYAAWLRQELGRAGTRFLPYPEEPHQRVVERDLLRQKPFDGKGRGYRDYLIWASLRSEMFQSPEETVVLITANTRDFCEDGELASSLKADLRRHHQSASVSVVPSLQAFNQRYLLPRIEGLKAWGAAPPAGEGLARMIASWAPGGLLKLLRYEDHLLIATHGLEREHAGCYVSSIDVIDDLQVLGVRQISPEKRLVQASAEVRAVLSLRVDWGQYERYRESRELLGESEPFSTAYWNETTTLSVNFGLVVNEAGTEILAGDLDRIVGPAGSFDIQDR